jgi:hypothetical protein
VEKEDWDWRRLDKEGSSNSEDVGLESNNRGRCSEKKLCRPNFLVVNAGCVNGGAVVDSEREGRDCSFDEVGRTSSIAAEPADSASTVRGGQTALFTAFVGVDVSFVGLTRPPRALLEPEFEFPVKYLAWFPFPLLEKNE